MLNAIKATLGFSTPIGGVELDISKLLQEKTHPTFKVAGRFLKVFQDHGVEQTQIPNFIDTVTMANLVDLASLLPVLNNSTFAQTAELFGISREWLETGKGSLYEHQYCADKSPESFFEALKNLNPPAMVHPIRVYCDVDYLDRRRSGFQYLVLVLAEKISTLGRDQEICRYKVFTEHWRWDYARTRIQLKAMVRLVYTEFHQMVPLYRVSSKVLKELVEGNCVPPPGEWLRDAVSLEDYCLTNDESGVAKETEEIEWVEAYIREHQLEPLAKSVAARWRTPYR